MSIKPQIITLGCRLNQVESDEIQRLANKTGLANLTVINSCAVTNEAVRQSRQAVRAARRANDASIIIATGCAAHIAPELFSKKDGVDHIINNNAKTSEDVWRTITATINGAKKPQLIGDLPSLRALGTRTRRARAYLRIQTGCDHSCTFCIIPQGRGFSRSVPCKDIIAEAKRLVSEGYREITLTGVDLTSWGHDLSDDMRLGTLIGNILRQVPELPLLRLSSLDSAELDSQLVELISNEPRIAPYLHLSLQSGDDMILKRMKRRHLRSHSVALCTALRNARPDIVLGADLIAGFPTETDEMFENTCSLIEECGLSLLHIFPFSPRKGTPAARMPQLPREIILQRARLLRELGAKARDRRVRQELGKERTILMETPNKGRTEHYFAAQLTQTGQISAGQLIKVKIDKVESSHLLASPI